MFGGMRSAKSMSIVVFMGMKRPIALRSLLLSTGLHKQVTAFRINKPVNQILPPQWAAATAAPQIMAGRRVYCQCKEVWGFGEVCYKAVVEE